MYFRRLLDLASIRDARYTPQYQKLYSKRKETVERVFAGAKKKRGMRYTLYIRQAERETLCVSLSFPRMNRQG